MIKLNFSFTFVLVSGGGEVCLLSKSLPGIVFVGFGLLLIVFYLRVCPSFLKIVFLKLWCVLHLLHLLEKINI